MNVLGNYSIDISTNQTYISKTILPFFCSSNNITPSLDAYFQNINPGERAEVEKKFFSAIHNLSNFDIVHFIKSSYKILKIKNQGKAFLQANSKYKKITGTIISLNHSDAMELNSQSNNNGEIFELELLLNDFIKQQKQKAGEAKIHLFLKIDVNLPKYTIGFPEKIITTLQTAFDKIIDHKIEVEEITLAVKLIRVSKTDFTVNFALEYNSKQATFYSFDTQLKNTEVHPELDNNSSTSNQSPNASIKILLAEDHKMNQVIATNLLKKEFKGVEVDVAENGLAAYEMVKSNTYDLVLMDINMPVLDGISATKKIRTELKSEIPILAFSAHVFHEQIQNCFIAGMNDFIPKPVNANTFRLKIKNALKYNTGKKINKPILKNLYEDLNKSTRIAV